MLLVTLLPEKGHFLFLDCGLPMFKVHMFVIYKFDFLFTSCNTHVKRIKMLLR